MDRYRKARAVERLLFVALLAALAVGGALYEQFRTEIAGWQLVALIGFGMGACYAAYRLLLYVAIRKPEPK